MAPVIPPLVCTKKYFPDVQRVRMQSGSVRISQLPGGGGQFSAWYAGQFRRPFVIAGLGTQADTGAPLVVPASFTSLQAHGIQNTYAKMCLDFFWAMCLANAQDYVDDQGVQQQFGASTFYPGIDILGSPVNQAFQRYMQKFIGDYDNTAGLWTQNFYELLAPSNDAANFWAEIDANIATEPDVYQRFLKLKRQLFNDGGGELWAPPGWYLFAPPAGNLDAYATDWLAFQGEGVGDLIFATVELDTDKNTGGDTPNPIWVTPR